jgi:integrase
MDGLRASARAGRDLLLQPDQIRILTSAEVYPILANLEARSLFTDWSTGPVTAAVEPPSKGPLPGATLDELLTDWLDHHVVTLAAPERYRYSVEHWRSFFCEEQRQGRIRPAPTVSDLTPNLQRRFRLWRAATGAGGHTISRDLAALRGALSWAWKHQKIARPPFIADVPAHLRARPRDRVLSFEEIARIIEACSGRPDREHLIRFIVIELGTAGRPQAVLELTDANIDLERNLIDPNQPGRRHLRKRRAIVPIAKAVRPWVTGLRGKLIKYKVPLADPTGGAFERETKSIRRCWQAACKEAGVADATPKTLRHTMLTWLASRGIPADQRQMLAGHSARGTTARNYEHLSPDYLKAAIREVDGFFRELRKRTSAIDRPRI